MTKLCSQCLVKEDIKDNQPPGQGQDTKNQAKWDVDQQLRKVVWTGDQFKPTTNWHSVSQWLHFSWNKTEKQQKYQYLSWIEFDWSFQISYQL